ncbi:hypothetical protein GGR57DRAFT_473964 [Xylariaceae sp. FL1272]|nr:hypothetical protein GGR57DRAFT_473964 [Xylariaceae sp. FL1272]
MPTRKRKRPLPSQPAGRTLRSGRVYLSTSNTVVPAYENVIEISDDDEIGEDEGVDDDESGENTENGHATETTNETLSSTGSSAVIEISDDDDSSDLSDLGDEFDGYMPLGIDDDDDDDDDDAENDDETLPPLNSSVPSKEASSSTIPSGTEHVVWSHAPMPQGYIYLKKGDAYLTRNCRLQTKKEGRDLYVVVGRLRGSKQQLGIRVPATIFASVMKSERESRRDRAEAVQKRDDKLEEKLRDEILRQYPKIPAANLPVLMKHATMKHSRRVGRSGTVDEVEKARLAVIAHIRHTQTDYDSILRNVRKTGRKDAREFARRSVAQTINGVLKTWGSSHAVESPWPRQRKGRDKSANIEKTKKANQTKAARPTISTAPARKAVIKKVKAKARAVARSHITHENARPETKDCDGSANNENATQGKAPLPVDSAVETSKKEWKKARLEKRKAKRMKGSRRQQRKGK